MAKYKVLVIAFQLKNQLIAVGNEVIDESQIDGNVGDLVKAGFLELDESEVADFDLKKLKKDDLIEFAKDNGIDIDEKSNKDVILNLIEDHLNSLEVTE